MFFANAKGKLAQTRCALQNDAIRMIEVYETCKRNYPRWECFKLQRESDGSFKYLTVWKGYEEEDNSWEPRSSFGTDPWQVEELERYVRIFFKI